MHPEYLSTKYALSLVERLPDLKAVPIQHHHAHIVSCMVEHGTVGPVIGIAFDATGFGIDGEKLADFQAVRGTLEDNAFIADLDAQAAQVEAGFQALEKKFT